jgi:hypothetical protein
MCARHLKPDAIRQYQAEERTLIARRVRTERYRLKALMDAMRADELAPPAKVVQLCAELNHHYGGTFFNNCYSMGDVVRLHIKLMLLGRPKVSGS